MITDVLNEQYALVEASYTTIRLLQEFDIPENAEIDQLAEPQLQANLVLAHRDGGLCEAVFFYTPKGGKRGLNTVLEKGHTVNCRSSIGFIFSEDYAGYARIC